MGVILGYVKESDAPRVLRRPARFHDLHMQRSPIGRPARI